MATQVEVAAHLRLSDRQIRNLSDLPGAPKPKGRGGWDLDAWRFFYIEYLRARSRDVTDGDEPEVGESSPERDREQRLKNEERQERILIARVKRRILARRYAPIELISAAVTRTSVELRTRVESWPSRLKKIWLDMPTEASQLLLKELAAALNELADIRIDLSGYDVSDIERDLDRIEALESDAADDGGGMG
ncbi:hypothetical protein Q0A17_06310 [Citrobacter sp. S2-9]|uniref:Uncharacterized protein n=1 Tax=Citrobacter enshiensis TaxID=2971264 RepID=A0ABT8PSF1_9ENTR|nr:hypothetical protein [Citrobacter enshiensis]MDN8599027.1 hypothetical protein [Citrobacter enshiensis]